MLKKQYIKFRKERTFKKHDISFLSSADFLLMSIYTRIKFIIKDNDNVLTDHKDINEKYIFKYNLLKTHI